MVNADGGPTSQAGAIVMGLGRALAKYDTISKGPFGMQVLTEIPA